MLKGLADPGKTLVFGASSQFKLLAASYVALFVYMLANLRGFPAASVLVAVFAVLPVFAWPPVITISDAGISRRSLWGRRHTIPWKELRSVVVSPRGIDITGDRGQMMRHSLLHARRPQFLQELSRRVPEKMFYRA